MKKKIVVAITLLSLIVFFFILYLNLNKNKASTQKKESKTEVTSYSSNIIKNVSYVSEDAKGNKYMINASTGEIDLTNSDLIYLTEVRAFVDLKDGDDVKITSDYGKYNINNYDTIFSKNVIIDYQKNKITGEYLDFSLNRDIMIISKKVIYTNFENILKADVIEVNIKTKDTKIFMHEDKKQVNIKSKD